jgi:hypothetical protein
MIIFEEHTSGMISECLDKHAQIGEKPRNFFRLYNFWLKEETCESLKFKEVLRDFMVILNQGTSWRI